MLSVFDHGWSYVAKHRTCESCDLALWLRRESEYPFALSLFRWRVSPGRWSARFPIRTTAQRKTTSSTVAPVDPTFDDIQEARQWMAKFTDWYNNQRRHSSIKYVTSSQRHDGLDIDILAARQQTYKQAKENDPAR